MEPRYIAMFLFPFTNLFVSICTGLLQRNSINNWHKYLIKPYLNPPGWIFGPVWTILYTLIGISGYLIWSIEEKFSENHKLEWLAFFLQLALNYLWSPVFFGMRQLGLASFIIVLMDVAIFFNNNNSPNFF